ncbi:jg14606 [Pararge aegeria aegeria]|uniref:Jg14606 protein n=1 Tax=Pararge aegeria aegeria TaxID=348720 RepID=A0A8S4QYA2_9NEOP|nr:jg14606 [Pararge aegeria aegeria]
MRSVEELRVTDIAQRARASQAHSSEKRWMLGSQGAGDPTPVNAAFTGAVLGRPPTRWTDIKRGFLNSLQKTYVQWTSIG